MSLAGVSCPASDFHKAPRLAPLQSGDFSVELVSLVCVIELGGISRGGWSCFVSLSFHKCLNIRPVASGYILPVHIPPVVMSGISDGLLELSNVRFPLVDMWLIRLGLQSQSQSR
jgi:hypothetical protein